MLALVQEKAEGKLADLWNSTFEKSGLPTTDVSAGVGNLFSVKDLNEQTCSKKSALLAASAMKNYAVNQLESMAFEALSTCMLCSVFLGVEECH